MKKQAYYLALILLTTGCSSLGTSIGGVFFPPRTLKEASLKPVGVAVNLESLSSDKNYRKVVLREFDSITPENAMKMENILIRRNTYDFSQADEFVEFGQKKKLKVRGHPLIWHRQLPIWLLRISDEEAEKIYEDYIRNLVSRYRGKVYSWDVVNESFLKNGNYRPSIWHEVFGKRYIQRAFYLARKYDKKAKLFYNDFYLERPGPKLDAVYKMLKENLEKGVPIDGIGLQTHLKYDSNVNELEKVIKKFSELGLIVEITELDVALPINANKQQKNMQKEVYQKVSKTCAQSPRCNAITFWGLSDKHSWIDQELPGYGSATLFDSNYKAKEVYFSVLGGLR